MKGFIYILVNDAMLGLCKIGMSERGGEYRAKETSVATGVPGKLELYDEFEIESSHFSNIREFEQWIFGILAKERHIHNKEFFRIEPIRVKNIVKPFIKKHYFSENHFTIPTPPIKEKVVKPIKEKLSNIIQDRRIPSFKFSMIGMNVGDIICFKRDKTIKAIISSDYMIKLLDSKGNEIGDEVSLSGSAKILLNAEYKVAGTEYWEYKGETLAEIRRRLEKETK